MEEHLHTTRLTQGGIVICVCGWVTAAAAQDPRETAASHIREEAGTPPLWVDRPGGTVCIPSSAAEPVAAGDGDTRPRARA